MCGIIGVTALRESIPNVTPILVEGLKRLEYRGYDSAGFAVIECESGRLVVRKDAGGIDYVVERYGVRRVCGRAGIAHTRWATHGPPNTVNAHPHTDCTGRIAVVHNGIIKNYLELRSRLEALGHRFVSETDTEVIPHFLEEMVSRGHSLLEALRMFVEEAEGAYAIAVISSLEPDTIYFARMLSPLVLGLGDGFNVVSSDIPSFLRLTRRVVVLEDGELGYIKPTMVYVEKRRRPVAVERRVRIVEWSAEDAEKGGYPHFMVKEIMEQPRALRETYMGVLSDDAVAAAVKQLASASTIFITGAGTSYHAALVYAYYEAVLAETPVIPFISSEYMVYSRVADEDTVLIAVSQSGETIDTLQAVRAFKERGARIVAVSNVVGSAIPRESHVTVYTRAGPEIGVAATKTFLTQILALQIIAVNHAAARGTLGEEEAKKLIDNLSKAPSVAKESLEKTAPMIEVLAKMLRDKRNMYVLGRELGAPLAYEAALKIKEVSYLHAEAYPAGESKHGPIALVEKGFPVIFVGTPPDHIVHRLDGNIQEMKARGATTILVATRQYEGLASPDYKIILGTDDLLLAPHALMPPLQLLAYRVAVLLGRDPDKPRNLAKTVTVE